VDWLPDDFFSGHTAPTTPSDNRPLSQGDIFTDVRVAGRTAVDKNGHWTASIKNENVIAVASSCGMRKAGGALNDVVHVAPIKELVKVAPKWGPPWAGWLHILPLPHLEIGGKGELGANLGRIGLCGADQLTPQNRLASVSLEGMKALKTRLAEYFTRTEIPVDTAGVGAHEEWWEISLWERWVEATGTHDGYQDWLDAENPNYSPRTRRETLYDDLVGIRNQLDEQCAQP